MSPRRSARKCMPTGKAASSIANRIAAPTETARSRPLNPTASLHCHYTRSTTKYHARNVSERERNSRSGGQWRIKLRARMGVGRTLPPNDQLRRVRELRAGVREVAGLDWNIAWEIHVAKGRSQGAIKAVMGEQGLPKWDAALLQDILRDIIQVQRDTNVRKGRGRGTATSRRKARTRVEGTSINTATAMTADEEEPTALNPERIGKGKATNPVHASRDPPRGPNANDPTKYEILGIHAEGFRVSSEAESLCAKRTSRIHTTSCGRQEGAQYGMRYRIPNVHPVAFAASSGVCRLTGNPDHTDSVNAHPVAVAGPDSVIENLLHAARQRKKNLLGLSKEFGDAV